MCEVTSNNFNEILPELEEIFKQSRFISIDTEFSCLNASEKIQNSLFDSGNERYVKLRTTVEQMIPLQIGITAFIFNPDRNLYTAHVYTFYVFPRAFAFVDKKFLCQASSFQFLSSHKFDFNKLVNKGISYLTRSQEEELSKRSDHFSAIDSGMALDIEHIIRDNTEIINKWIHGAKINDVLILTSLEPYANNFDVLYFLHKEIRERFKLWTFEDQEGFKIQKLTPECFKNSIKESNLNEIFISRLLGFSKIIRLLTSIQKPIIGHNLLLDLMVIVHNFEKSLPKSYTGFKQLINDLFPIIYDTKCMSFDISKTIIPETKRWSQNTLQFLYEYFKDGHGRHLALNSPLIEPSNSCEETFHYAGWDSYCTGYIFIRMAHIYAAQRCTVRNKKFMSSELLQAIMQFKNSINVIRADVSHIQLDGVDPISKRPPWLIIESKKKPININQVTSLLSTYGFVEVKPYSFKGAIIAVDNFGSARRILRQFQSHSDFKIQPYNTFRHSPIARAFLWSGIAASGVILAWYGYSKIK